MYYDVTKAVKQLGLPQSPIKTALQDAVNWFREAGYVSTKSPKSSLTGKNS
jgi:dihydroflavonol-4-reductase